MVRILSKQFSYICAVWFSGVQDEKLLVGLSESVEVADAVISDGIIAGTDRPVDIDSEASPHFSIHETVGCIGGKSDVQMLTMAAAEDTSTFAIEKMELKKSMAAEMESSKPSELLNDHGNSEDHEWTLKDAGSSAVDNKSAEQGAIDGVSADCSSSPSQVEAMNDVGECDGAADGSGPKDNGPNCIDLAKVSFIQIHRSCMQVWFCFLGLPFAICHPES